MMMNNQNIKNLRGLQYRNVDLAKKNFKYAQAGQQPIRKIFIKIMGLVATFLCSLIPAFSGEMFGWVVIYFGIGKNYGLGFIGISIIVYILALALIIVRGFEVASIIIMIGLIVTSGISVTLIKGIGLEAGIFFLILSIVLAWIGAIITAYCVTFIYLDWGILGELLAILGSGFITVVSISLITSSSQDPKPGEGIPNLIAAIAVILTGAIIATQAVRGSPKFAWMREQAVFWGATGGTSFYGADLTDACFDGAELPHTDFRKANLTRTSFEGVTGLELARLQGTILEQQKIRKLLITKRGRNEDYTGANLTGAFLRGADLTGAILTEVKALDADFSGATMTGACIQEWNINKNTRFKDVECKRVYLKCSREGDRIILSEQKPDSGEFKPGEFEKWITEIQNTVDLIFQQGEKGLSWRAFAFSLAQTLIDREGLDPSRYSVERKEDGTVVVKVGVSSSADKAAIHQALGSNYYSALEAIEANKPLVLQAQNAEILQLKGRLEADKQIIQELISVIAGTNKNVYIQGRTHRIYMLSTAGEVEIMESKKQFKAGGDIIDGDKGDKTTVGNITISGDVTGSNLLGDLSGRVSVTIQQLKDVKTGSSDEIGKILTALQESIVDDTALSENQKKEALEAVETLAEEGKKPPEKRALKYCSMALNALNGIATAVTDASKLAEVLKLYLPTLTSILGI